MSGFTKFKKLFKRYYQSKFDVLTLPKTRIIIQLWGSNTSSVVSFGHLQCQYLIQRMFTVWRSGFFVENRRQGKHIEICDRCSHHWSCYYYLFGNSFNGFYRIHDDVIFVKNYRIAKKCPLTYFENLTNSEMSQLFSSTIIISSSHQCSVY